MDSQLPADSHSLRDAEVDSDMNGEEANGRNYGLDDASLYNSAFRSPAPYQDDGIGQVADAEDNPGRGAFKVKGEVEDGDIATDAGKSSPSAVNHPRDRGYSSASASSYHSAAGKSVSTPSSHHGRWAWCSNLTSRNSASIRFNQSHLLFPSITPRARRRHPQPSFSLRSRNCLCNLSQSSTTCSVRCSLATPCSRQCSGSRTHKPRALL